MELRLVSILFALASSVFAFQFALHALLRPTLGALCVVVAFALIAFSEHTNNRTFLSVMFVLLTGLGFLAMSADPRLRVAGIEGVQDFAFSVILFFLMGVIWLVHLVISALFRWSISSKR